MWPMRTAPAVWELEGPTMMGPSISKISIIGSFLSAVGSLRDLHRRRVRLTRPAAQLLQRRVPGPRPPQRYKPIGSHCSRRQSVRPKLHPILSGAAFAPAVRSRRLILPLRPTLPRLRRSPRSRPRGAFPPSRPGWAVWWPSPTEGSGKTARPKNKLGFPQIFLYKNGKPVL